MYGDDEEWSQLESVYATRLNGPSDVPPLVSPMLSPIRGKIRPRSASRTFHPPVSNDSQTRIGSRPSASALAKSQTSLSESSYEAVAAVKLFRANEKSRLSRIAKQVSEGDKDMKTQVIVLLGEANQYCSILGSKEVYKILSTEQVPHGASRITIEVMDSSLIHVRTISFARFIREHRELQRLATNRQVVTPQSFQLSDGHKFDSFTLADSLQYINSSVQELLAFDVNADSLYMTMKHFDRTTSTTSVEFNPSPSHIHSTTHSGTHPTTQRSKITSRSEIERKLHQVLASYKDREKAMDDHMKTLASRGWNISFS
jgi:hypothetical protein